MPTSVGPNTKGEENLVFGYDLGDTGNSYKGEPTVNLVTNAATFNGGWATYDNGNDGTFITEFGTVGYQMVNRGSWNGIYQNFNLVNSGTYTFSAWFKYLGGAASPNGGTVYISNYGSGDDAAGINKDLIGQWQRVTKTLSVTSPTNVYFYIISYGGTYGGDKHSWQVTMPQIELNSHATPFVGGTRSATQGLLDLTGNSTIDLSNVSFDSNAQPAWDATNDYISRDSVIQYTTSQPWTVELVMNPGSNDAPLYWNGLFGYNLSLGGYWMFHSGNGTLTWYEYPSQLLYTSINLGDEIPWNSNTHLVFVYDGASNYKIYVNNVLRFDSNRTFYAGYSGGFRYIGGVASENRYGRNSIPYFKNYNRALTAQEVRANYNAIKGRFNI
jgi:hypothetical protein